MRRPLVALCVSTGLLLGLVGASPVSADAHFKDPYRPSPPLFDTWCALDPASIILETVEESPVGDAFWWLVETFTDQKKPQGGAFSPMKMYEAGCARATAYKQERMNRGDLLNQTGYEAQLWQNRPFPDLLGSAEEPPDFVVVGMGDSFASGEGNPATSIDWASNPTDDEAWAGVTWTEFTDSTVAQSESDDPEAAMFCHRSSKSAFASAMMEMRRLYPQFNIYWRNFACSGAETRHVWRDKYVTWGFFQSQHEAGVKSSDSDGTAYLKVANSNATQPTQISQASAWLKTFPKTPKVDATYMSIGGNDVFFGPVIGECARNCEPGKKWTDLAQAAITGGTVPDTALDTLEPAAEMIDPLGASCSLTVTVEEGCLSRQPGQKWSTVQDRYLALDKSLQATLKPTRTYLAEVPDFTHSDNGVSYCEDSDPPTGGLAKGVSPGTDAELVAGDPYLRMDSDWLLSFSEKESWKYAHDKVGWPLVQAIRKAVNDDGTGQVKWHLVSLGPKGDRLWEAWQEKHGMCALEPYVNSLIDATDSQGEDMDAEADVSAGVLHPNAFGQQDYAERILYAMLDQLLEKMTPKLILGSAAWRAAALAGWLALGGKDATTVDISLPWKDLDYPNGNDRPSVFVRTTPIKVDIARVGLQVLQRAGSITYSLDLPRQSEEEFTGAEVLPTGAFGATTRLEPEDAGVVVEVRACGPEAYDGDHRTCGKWQGVGSYTRPPVDIYDPEAYAALRKIERRLSDANFAARLKQVLVKTAASRSTPIKVGSRTIKLPFGWSKTLPLTPLSAGENALPVVETNAGVNPDWTWNDAALTDSPDPDKALECGIPEDLLREAIDALLEKTKGSLSGQGARLVACLEQGGTPVEFPQNPQFGDGLLENECGGASQEQVDRIVELIPNDSEPKRSDKESEPEIFQLYTCLHDHGVPLLDKQERAALRQLQACSLTMLDWPILVSRYSPIPATRDAIDCLRTNQGLPPVYWFERRTGNP